MIKKVKSTAWHNCFHFCVWLLVSLLLTTLGTLPTRAEESSASNYFNSGKAYFTQGNYEQALEMFEQAITGDPDNDEYYEYKGDCLVNLWRISEALEMFNSRIIVKPEYPGNYIWKGYCRFLLADFNNAIADFEQAAALSIGNQENLNYIYLLKGICEVILDQNEQALQSFAESIKNGEDKYNLFWKANTLIGMQNYQEAYATYNRAAQILDGQASESDTTAFAYNNMAYCQIQLEDYSSALELAEQGLSHNSSSAVLYKNQGLALQGLGRYEEANAAYQQALSLEPEYPPVMQALEDLGKQLLPEAKDLAFASTNYEVDQGQTTSTRVNACYTPGSGSAFQINASTGVQYQSNNPAIAVIDNKGVITGIAGGETSITASYSGSGKTLTATANIKIYDDSFPKPQAQLNLSVSPANAGIVSGSGSYPSETEVTINAVPNPGYRFANWTEDEGVVSTESSYQFTVTDDRNLLANFIENWDDSQIVDKTPASGPLIVSADRIWTIKLSTPADADSINSNLEIVNEAGEKASITTILSDDKKSITITPAAPGYASGHTYTLRIKLGLCSEEGLFLQKPVIMRFKVQ